MDSKGVVTHSKDGDSPRYLHATVSSPVQEEKIVQSEKEETISYDNQFELLEVLREGIWVLTTMVPERGYEWLERARAIIAKIERETVEDQILTGRTRVGRDVVRDVGGQHLN